MINKKIYIVNGMARCGKDTFAELLNEFVPTHKCSSIDIIKDIATCCGWDGGKTEKDRKFLSDLKMLTTEYSDLSFNYMCQTVKWFREESRRNVMLIDIREPLDIHRARKEFDAKTILIKNDRVPIIKTNMADANVFNYEYDYIIDNNDTLDEYKSTVKKFAEEEQLCQL